MDDAWKPALHAFATSFKDRWPAAETYSMKTAGNTVNESGRCHGTTHASRTQRRSHCDRLTHSKFRRPQRGRENPAIGIEWRRNLRKLARFPPSPQADTPACSDRADLSRRTVNEGRASYGDPMVMNQIQEHLAPVVQMSPIRHSGHQMSCISHAHRMTCECRPCECRPCECRPCECRPCECRSVARASRPGQGSRHGAAFGMGPGDGASGLAPPEGARAGGDTCAVLSESEPRPQDVDYPLRLLCCGYLHTQE